MMMNTGARKSQRGQVMVIGAMLSMVFVFFWMALFGVGEAVAERTHLQDTADAVAYTQGVWCARWLNWLAYSNRAIIANMIILTQFSIIHSHAKFWFDIVGVFGLVADALKALFGIGAALDPFVRAAATVVTLYEKFAREIADIGIPIYHCLIGVLHVLQNVWFIFLILFPFKSNQVMAYMDPELFETTDTSGISGLIDGFSNFDSGTDISSILSSVGQLAFLAYAYYQYFMLMMHKEDPAKGSITDTIGGSKLDTPGMFNRKIGVWKRWKWIAGGSAHKHANGHENPLVRALFPWRWDARALVNLNISLGIDLGIVGFKIEFVSGGETHIERWSLSSDAAFALNLGGNDLVNSQVESQKGDAEFCKVGLWQWHTTIGGEPGDKVYDSYAHDFFELRVKIKFPFIGWITVFSLGIHEVELSSEDYGTRETEDDSSSNDPGQQAQDAGEDGVESGQAMQEEAEEKWAQAEDKREDANELDSEAAELDSEATELRNAEPPNEAGADSLNASATSKRSSATSLRSQADTLQAEGDKLNSDGIATEEQGEQTKANGAALSSEIGGVLTEITSALYHDGPVLFFWAYMHPRWASGDGPSPRETKNRFVFPSIGDATYEGRLTPPHMWEVNTATDKISGYKWATEPSPGVLGDNGRSVAHYSLIFRPYKHPIENATGVALFDSMFGNNDDDTTPMLGNQYTAISRAEVVYVNPFKEDEIPNVMNPWWRARLSPISKDISSITSKVGDITSGIGETIDDILTKLFTH